MKKYIIPLSIVAATFAASCSSDENLPQEIDNSMKTPIEFSMTDNTSSMNVGVSGVTRAGFTSSTDMVVKMVAEEVQVGGTSTTPTARKSTITKATAERQSSVNKDDNTSYTYSNVSFNHDNSEQRYWDDAYGRNTQLSIFAVAVKDKTNSDKFNNLTASSWTDDNNISSAMSWSLNWTVTNGSAQTETSINDEDLVYSNNIQSNGQSGKREYDFTSSQYKPVYDLSDGRLAFQLKESGKADGPGKFNTGNLNFTHALSRITLKIKLAAEFGNNASLDDNEVKVLNMPYTGTLDVVNGQFSNTTTKDAIVMAPLSNSESDIKGIYMAQVLPGYKIAQNSNNMLQFKVYTGEMNNPTSQNIYYVTNNSVYSAIESNSAISSDKDENNNITMAQGKHYILTITVGKTAINDITATLVDWTTVTGEHTQDNAYLTFTNSFASYTTSTNAEHFDLYRLNDPSTDVSTDGRHKVYKWGTGWSDDNKATLNWDATNNKWTTNWFFEDNKSFYHFRTVGQGESGEDVSKTYTTRTIHTDATSGDYFDIEAGKTDGRYYWGAPMVSGKELKYSPTYGYDYSDTDHHLFYAIGATNSNIHITQLHMLSKIRVVLKTVAASQGGVNLQSDENKTTVKITNVFTKGKVNMGNGLVTAGTSSTGNDSRNSVDMTTPSPFFKESSNLETNEFTYFIVPQTLVDDKNTTETTDDVYIGLEIKTPDNNIYYVVKKLSEIKATSVGNNGTQEVNKPIKWWYPNHSYLYTITLKKTGIEKITCTLVDWTEVTGNNQDVTIED